MAALVLKFPTMTKSKGIRKPIDRPNRIAQLRKAAGMTMAELAARVNITPGHLGNIERGQRELTMPVMERLAEHLGCLPADLLNPSDGGLTDDERFLISTYREVPEGHRQTFRAVAEAQQPFRGAPEVVPLDRGNGSRKAG